MAENDRGAGHAMFGLNNDPTDPGGTPTPTPAPGAPQYVYVQAPAAAPAPSGGSKVPMWLGIVLLVISVANLAFLFVVRSQFKEIASKQSDQLDVLTRRMNSSDDRYAQLSGKFQVTTEKLGLTQQELEHAKELAANIQKQQQTAVTRLNQAIAQKASADEVNKVQQEANAKIGGLSTDLAGTQKELENTKSQFTDALTGTKGELGGAIARTHDELVALAHKGDRDYYEFTLPSRHAPQKIGTVTVDLEKTDTRKNTFSLYLTFDDKRTARKDKAMDEPIYFYVQGAPSALEIVVNKVGKNTISGYLSSPKGFFPNTPNVLSARPGM
jgi:hypothetical protein